jgi:uncharacterized membrane protein YbhN (UPF0104 family)
MQAETQLPLLPERLRCPRARRRAVCAAKISSRSPDDTSSGADSTFDTRRVSELRKWLLPTLSVALFVAALWIVHAEVATLHLRDVLAEARRVQTSVLLGAFALTALSYWLLGFYDVIGLSYIRRRIPYLRTTFVSFIAFAFGHNLSLAALTGTAVRYRLYASMVIGAYGHSRTRQLIVGSTTTAMIRTCLIPVLLLR